MNSAEQTNCRECGNPLVTVYSDGRLTSLSKFCPGCQGFRIGCIVGAAIVAWGDAIDTMQAWCFRCSDHWMDCPCSVRGTAQVPIMTREG